MIKGVNTDPLHGATPQSQYDLLGEGGFIRTAPWQDVDFDYNKWAQELQKLNLNPVYILDLRALTRGSKSYYQHIKHLRNKYPTVQYWQIGNEEDVFGQESSSGMRPKIFQALLLAAADALPDKYRIGGAFASGSLDYPSQIAEWPVHGIGFNPYGQRPDDWPNQDYGFGNVRDLYNMYQQYFPDKEMWISELGNADFDEETRAAYHQSMLSTVDSCGAKAALVFCYDDYGGFGLIDAEGTPNRVYDVLQSYTSIGSPVDSGVSGTAPVTM
jgi:hypothetical protein